MMKFVIPVILVVSTAQCSPAGSSYVPEEPDPPTVETLCKIVPGKTTVQEAIQILGAAQQQISMGTKIDLFYQYRTTVGGQPAHANLNLEFANGVLFNTSTMNMNQPACWAADGGVVDSGT